jgi:hypothetical protein
LVGFTFILKAESFERNDFALKSAMRAFIEEVYWVYTVTKELLTSNEISLCHALRKRLFSIRKHEKNTTNSIRGTIEAD